MPRYIMERTAVDDNGCWIWKRQISKNGYGHFRCTAKDKWHYTHQESFLAFNGKILLDLNVLHKCDVPNCCNPEHLYLGTNKNNHADMVARGRVTKGNLPLTICRRGHQLNKETRLGKRAKTCKICHRMRQTRYRREKCHALHGQAA